MCGKTGLIAMIYAASCIEGYYCMYGTTPLAMLNQKVFPGYYGGYNITGLAEFYLCPAGKYCPSGTAASKVAQQECLKNYYCPLGTLASLNSEGLFTPGVRTVDRTILIKAVKEFTAEMQMHSQDFAKNATLNKLNETMSFYALHLDQYLAQYNRLKFDF
jgi:hypothetical protein